MLELKRRTPLLLVVVLLSHILLISGQTGQGAKVSPLEVATFVIFSRIQRMTSTVMNSIDDIWSGYIGLQGTNKENELLRNQVNELHFKLQERSALVNRTLRLEQLLELRSKLDLPTTAASILAVDATPWFRAVTVDKGFDDGLRQDMAVLGPQGIVGRVVGQIGPTAAKVQLIIDREAAAGAVLEQTGVAGVITGIGSTTMLSMNYVSNFDEVNVGERVITSGIEGIYPRGFTIGRVKSVENGPGLHQVIEITPAVDFSQLSEVIVVLLLSAEALPAEDIE